MKHSLQNETLEKYLWIQLYKKVKSDFSKFICCTPQETLHFSYFSTREIIIQTLHLICNISHLSHASECLNGQYKNVLSMWIPWWLKGGGESLYIINDVWYSYNKMTPIIQVYTTSSIHKNWKVYLCRITCKTLSVYFQQINTYSK